MTKNHLIKKLEKIPGNPEILLSSDGEGNSYSELDEIYTGENNDLRYRDESDEYSSGLVLYGPKDIEDGEILEKHFNKLKKCIVLYPG